MFLKIERDKYFSSLLYSICKGLYSYFSSETQKKMCPIRSSHRRCSVKKDVLRNFAKFTGKHLCQSLFFNKVAGLRPEKCFRKMLKL